MPKQFPASKSRAEQYWDAAHCSPFELRPLSLPGPGLISTIKGYDLRLTKVVVWETENASAEVTVDSSRNQADAMLRQAQQSNLN